MVDTRWTTAGRAVLVGSLIAGGLGCGHDADRSNPLDPELTPPVSAVEARATAQAGTIVVTWQPYAGEQPFAHYAVLRKEKGIERIDTLDSLFDVAAVSYLDTTASPDRDYEYFVAVANRAGFVVTSSVAAVRSPSVDGVELQSVQGDALSGQVQLRWLPYAGPGFGGLSVWRQVFGQEPVELWSAASPTGSTYADTAAMPGIVYTYWLRAELFGEAYESRRLQVTYELPAAHVTGVTVSSLTATAAVRWQPYEGPRFATYEILRSQLGRPDTVVARIADPQQTLFVDTRLDGNTAYTYRVRVQTTWEGISVTGAGRLGRFYALTGGAIRYTAPENTEVQALDIAIDETDGLWAFATHISTTTARLMQSGVAVYRPGMIRSESRLPSVLPDRLSPVHGAVLDGASFIAVADAAGFVAVAGYSADGAQTWLDSVDTDGEMPVALFVEDGDLVLIDEQAIIYRFDPQTGEGGIPSTRLHDVLTSHEGLPVQNVIEAPEAGRAGNDQWILLAPLRSQHKILGRLQTWLGTTPIFGGTSDFYDDGVGPGRGESLSPLAVGFDALHNRLVFLENRGLVQVVDAGVDVSPRAVTGWGEFGEAEGEFFFTPPTVAAVAVDSEGRIHVADAGARGGRVQVFAP